MDLSCRRHARIGLTFATIAFSVLTARSASATAIDFTGYGKYNAIRANLSGYVYDGPGGELTWRWWDSVANAPGDVPTGYSPTFYAYCIDILQSVTDPETVTVRSTDLLTSSTTPYVADAGAKAAWLFNQYAVDVHNNGDGVQAAALQVAIWESLYDTSASLSGGSFTLQNSPLNSAQTNLDIANQAMTYLTALYAGPNGSYNTSVGTWLDANLNQGQDQILAMPVPEPGSVLLFGTGLLGLARGIRRRQRGGAAGPVLPS